MHIERFILTFLLLAAGQSALAAPASYQIDPVHTRIVFAVAHYEFSQALGTLSGASGRLQFDPKDWSSASVEVSVPLVRLDLGDADWNARMLKRDFFDLESHPVAHFQSTRIEPINAQEARIVGLLSLRGVQREVSLLARFNRLARHPLTMRRTVGFSARATLDRRDFGMTRWDKAIGHTVELRIELEANRRSPARAGTGTGTERSPIP